MAWQWTCCSIQSLTEKSYGWHSNRKQPGSSGATMRKDRLPGGKRPSWCMEPTARTRRQPELATIAKVTIGDLQAWHDHSLDGKLIISISGDFDSAAMEAKLRATFEGLPQAQAQSGAA